MRLKLVWLLSGVVSLGLVFLPVAAQAIPTQTSPILAQAFLTDPSGTMTIEQVSQATFTPYFTSSLSQGYTQSTTWVRLNIRPSLQVGDPVVLRVEPHFLDQADLYQMTQSGWVKSSAGDQTAYSPISNDGAAFRFEVHPSDRLENWYYLSIKTSSMTYFTLRAFNPAQANQFSKDEQWGFGIQLGVLLLLLRWTIANYVTGREKILGIFVIFQTLVILVNLSAWGALDRFVFPNHPHLDDLSFSYLFCLRMASSVWLGWAILSGYKTPQWYPKVCQATYYICVIECIAISLGYVQMILKINMTLVFLWPFLQVWGIYKTTQIPLALRRYLMVAYSVIALILALAIASINNFLGMGSASITLMYWIGFINSLIIFLMIWKRYQIDQTTLKEHSKDLVILQAKSEIEKNQLIERSTLIDMLVHELKNPLATIKMAVGSLQHDLLPNQPEERQRINNMNAATENMNSVIERCMLVDQFDQKKLVPYKTAIDLNNWIEALVVKKDYADRITTSAPKNCTLLTDPQLLEIALSNLLDNAIKYSNPNSQVLLKVCSFERHEVATVLISVSNQEGDCGIPDSKEVFTRYYRNPYAHSTSGTGLGLFLSKAIITLLGGNLLYKPDGHVVRFMIELPRAPSELSI